MLDFKLGQTVETSAHQQGLVKYIGPIHVADGIWLGIELATPDGKNDGSVRGERYFTCSPAFGLFVRDVNIVRVIAQPAPKAAAKTAPPTAASKAPAKPKATAPAPKAARPSSVSAPRTAPRPSSVITKRQSVAPASTTQPALRAPVRKASITGSSSTSTTATSSRPQASAPRASIASSTTSTTVKAPRDSNVETLQTKIRHLEKQHGEDLELLKELSQAKDERDRFHGIIQKLQSKCQSLHQDAAESKAQAQQLQTHNDKLSKAQEEHEADWEIALLDKEMAEERAEQAESELDTLRSKLEERDMELEILRDEAEMFTADMSEDEKQEAGYYRLQHENERFRQVLVQLREMTAERERDSKARISELESDVSVLESLRQENADLLDQVQKADAIIEHLRAQVDASAEWEDVSNELTNKNQELEDRIATQDALIRDLESLKELNDELEAQHMDEAEDLLAELAVKDNEIAEQSRKIQDQEAVIADSNILISKFRDLVFELQSRMADAETSRNMTETQVKDTTGRFNEVMDLNRRLRASNVQATSKEITSELHRVRADQVTEKLAICAEAESTDFGNSEPVRAYFTSKSVAAKATLIASLLANTDRQLSYDGGLDEALSRLLCVEAIYHLTVLETGSNRLWSAMAVAPLEEFASYGPTYGEISTVEKALDQGLEALKVDEVNFGELAGSFERSNKIQDAILSNRQTALAALPEDSILTWVRNITAGLEYLDSNFAVVNTMLRFLANFGNEYIADVDSPSNQSSTIAEVTERARGIIEQYKTPTAECNKALLFAQKLLKTVTTLRKDGLYPRFPFDFDDISQVEIWLRKTVVEAAKWARSAHESLVLSFGEEGNIFTMKWKVDHLSFFDIFEHGPCIDFDHTIEELTRWNEDASILLNSNEIVRGQTPWSQKAKEVGVARKKNSESSVLLENLKVEHKATLLSLHERERVIETKSLEIEHLEAKYRDATNKAADAQLLRDKLAHAEVHESKLMQQLRALNAKLDALEQFARSDRSDHTPQVQDITKPAAETVEQPAASRPLPPQFHRMVAALQTENHWLRQRQNSEMLDRNLRYMFEKMRQRTEFEKWALTLKEGILLEEEEDELEDLSMISMSDLKGSQPSPIARPRMSPHRLGGPDFEWRYEKDEELSMIGEESEDEDLWV
jgi:dynactin 1